MNILPLREYKETPLFLIILSICFSFYYVDLGFALKPFMLLSAVLFVLSVKTFVTHSLFKYEIALLCYFAYYCTTGIFAKYPAASLRFIFGVFLVIFCYFVIKYFMHLVSINGIEKAIFISGFIFNGLSVLLYILGILKVGYIGGNQIRELGVLMDRGFPRLIGLTSDPNIFCFYNFIFFFYYLTHLDKKGAKLGFLLTSATMLFSLSRGGIISVVLGLLLMFITLSLSKKIKMIVGVGFSVVALNLFVKILFKIDFIQLILERFMNGDAGSGRIDIWEKGLALLGNYPFFGVGIGNYRPHVIAEYGNAIYMHNTYMEALVEGGFIGLFLYSLIFILVFITYFKNKSKLNDKGYLIFTFTAVAFMMSTYSFMVNEIFFLVLALIWRYLYEAQSSIKQSRSRRIRCP